MERSKRQIEIIEAATEIIGEKGIQNLTTKNLAAKMGFTEPALYRHYKGKTEILESVLIYYKDQLRLGLATIMESNLTGIEKIGGMINFQFNHFTKYPAIIMVIFAETSFQYDKVLSKAVSQIMTQKRTMVSKIVESGQNEGNIRSDIDALQLTNIIMGSMRFTILNWRLSNFNLDLLKEGKTLWETIYVLTKKQ